MTSFLLVSVITKTTKPILFTVIPSRKLVPSSPWANCPLKVFIDRGFSSASYLFTYIGLNTFAARIDVDTTDYGEADELDERDEVAAQSYLGLEGLSDSEEDEEDEDDEEDDEEEEFYDDEDSIDAELDAL